MSCKICKGMGFLFREEGTETVAYPCTCRKEYDKKKEIEIKYIDAGIPKKFWYYTMDSYKKLPFPPKVRDENATSISTIESIIEDPKKLINGYRVLWIYGRDDNSGHTSLAIILGKELIEKHYKVKFIYMQNLIDAFVKFNEKQTYFKDLESYNVYIIDDAFDTSRSFISGDYTRVQLFNWINDALDKEKSFICTSNTEVDKLDTIYSQIQTILKRNIKELRLNGSVTTRTSHA